MEKQLKLRGQFSQDFRHCPFFKRSKKTWRARTFNLKSSRTGSFSLSVFNDTDWSKKGNDGICFSNAEKVKNYAMHSCKDTGRFLGPGSEKKWYGGSSYPSKGDWDSTADVMVLRFKESGHPVFKSTSPLSR